MRRLPACGVALFLLWARWLLNSTTTKRSFCVPCLKVFRVRVCVCLFANKPGVYVRVGKSCWLSVCCCCCRQPQLGCLHVIDMDQQERAEFVCAFPRLLTIDAEACLLPLLEYLQASRENVVT